MNREPSAHSMTVETSDRENLAERVFLLEQWKAKAVQTISQLEGERDEARAETEAARKEIARLGEVADEVAGQAVRDVREATDKLHRAVAERDKVVRERNEAQHQLIICREDLATADRTVRVTKAALDAAIEAV